MMTQPLAEQVTALDTDPELLQRLEESRIEYGTYQAASRIYAGNALAYDIGHPVPVSNVIRHGYWFNGQVILQDGAEHTPQMLALIQAAQPAPEPTGQPAAAEERPADTTEGVE